MTQESTCRAYAARTGAYASGRSAHSLESLGQMVLRDGPGEVSGGLRVMMQEPAVEGSRACVRPWAAPMFAITTWSWGSRS